MKTLLLLRHAEAAGREPGAGDAERRLTAAGRRDAERLGAWLRARFGPPGLVLCSAARRARETLEALALPATAQVLHEPDLYLAGPDALLERVGEIPLLAEAAAPEVALLVGHNPGIAELAEWLAAVDDSPERRRLRAGFPPAALAALGLELDDWSGASPRCARLLACATPADLEPGETR